MNTLLVIDGHAMIHRAYHALPPLTDKEGSQVNAVYGFFSMLLRVIEDVHPTHLAVCFDLPTPTFRKQLYAGYQAHRPQMVSELSSQIALIHESLLDVGVTTYSVAGYEADDVIGTIALQATQEKKETEVKIVTGDRDLLQLVTDRVHILFPTVGISKMTEFDEEKVKEKFGVQPDQIIDYKALIGDASDGYSGVRGIGPKTAVSLLTKFHSFETIYTHINEIAPSIALKLANDAEQGALSKKLATIVTDVPIHFGSEKASIEHFTKEKLYIFCDRFQFTSLKKRIQGLQGISEGKPDKEQLALL